MVRFLPSYLEWIMRRTVSFRWQHEIGLQVTRELKLYRFRRIETLCQNLGK